MILFDAGAFATAFLTAYLLRFEFQFSPLEWHQIRTALPLIIPAKILVFFCFRLYRGMWRYFSLEDTWRLAYATLFSSLLSVTLLVYTHGFKGFPRSVFVLDGVLTFLLCGGLRMGIRSYYTAVKSPRGADALCLPRLPAQGREQKRVLIIGAGGAGEKLLREVHDNPNLNYRVVGFLDDDPAKHGRSLHSVPVIGAVDSLPDAVRRFKAEQVFISVPSATGPQMRRIVERCKESGIPFKTLPAMGEIMDGRVNVSDLREVNYEDLLRRPCVDLDTSGIRQYLADRTVLVTGCGGSIGSELCRQIISFGPARLVLIDASEVNLYHIEMELQNDLHFKRVSSILCRTQDRPLIERTFSHHRPEVVFHAAAYKHVPILELNPWEAVFNNILGSQVVMETAVQCGVDRFVLVSTDKAVRPTNVMGVSKRICELLLQACNGTPPASTPTPDSAVQPFKGSSSTTNAPLVSTIQRFHGSTKFMAVRFGNVIGSSGSVVPLFQKQIQKGGPVTVTHPEVTRYFMTIPEAAQLILQAGALGRGGEVFVLEMGTPVLIADMARDLIRLSGKEPDHDIPILYTGLRPGEKLYEELITSQEGIVETGHDKIMVLQPNGDWCGRGSHEAFREWLNREIEELYSIAGRHDVDAIKRKLKEIVPGYTPYQADPSL